MTGSYTDGDDVIPGHILSLMCAVHLRQDHGYKGRSITWFRQQFPGLCMQDGGFGFATLHLLHHTTVGSIVLDDLGLEVAYIAIDPDQADHLTH